MYKPQAFRNLNNQTNACVQTQTTVLSLMYLENMLLKVQ